jgi:trk system potassium uptake protein TrkA
MILKGHEVTVVDKNPEAFKRLGPVFTGRRVAGVGFDQDVLREAGIERADGLAAVTSSDEANFVAARIAKQIFRVPKVVARLYDPGQAEIYSRLGLQTVAPVHWGTQRIADLLLLSGLETTCNIGAGGVDLVALEATYLLVGRTVASLSMPGEFQVVAVTRGGKTFLPTRGTVFQEGDLIHLVVLASSANRLDQLLKSQEGG